MSEDHAGFPDPLGSPLVRARDYFGRRGQVLPPAALRLLAREVILRVSHSAVANRDPGAVPLRSEVDALCDALLSHDDAAGSELVRAARLGGMSARGVYHDYLAKAVHQFGDRWERDEATAAQVILGAGRVYAILRDLRSIYLAEHLSAPPGAEAVFATVPGEVHGMGITFAADTMRLRGWDIALRVGLGHDALVEEIAALRPLMVGLSATQPSQVLPAARLIVALRMRCPQVWIILGGGLVAADPAVAQAVDADAAAVDMDDGAAQMVRHLEALNRLAAS
jgi:MerR family transcriptional regulator, light-induced transcriptional regulator